MGRVDRVLAEVELPNRDEHNCRVFIDLAENVHIHYREHRLVFTVEEYLAVSEVFSEGAKTLRQRVKDGYKEQDGFRTEIIGGNQSNPIKCEKPNESYFNNRMVIEKNYPEVIDSIHIHYRDYRLVMDNMETFERFCECVAKAKEALGN